GAARQVGGWLAGGNAGLDPLGDEPALCWQQAGVEERIKGIDRQVERIEQEKRSIVTGRRRAVAVAEVGCVEAGDRVAPIVAQRDEFACNIALGQWRLAFEEF